MERKATSAIAIALLLMSTLVLSVRVSPGASNVDLTAEKPFSQDAAYDWPMIGYDPASTSYSPSSAPNCNSTAWVSDLPGGTVWAYPVVAEGKVFVGTGGNFTAWDKHDGSFLWTFRAPAQPGYAGGTAVADGRVFFGTAEPGPGGCIYALNTTTGEKIWNFTTEGYLGGSPVIVGDRLYFGGDLGIDQGKIYCINATTGVSIWNYTTHDRMSSLAVAYDKVYGGCGHWITSTNAYIYCLDMYDGGLEWSFDTGRDLGGALSVANGKVYTIASLEGSQCAVFALNATNGDEVWSTTRYAASEAGRTAVAYGKVFISLGYSGRGIYALNETNGDEIWAFPIIPEEPVPGHQNNPGGPVVADGKAFFAVHSPSHMFYAVNESSGAVVWDYELGGSVHSRSYAIANEAVYVADHYDKKLYAFGAYLVTIEAYCYTEVSPVSVAIQMDGAPTGFSTPHTFRIICTHTFTVPNNDPTGHPFYRWSTGVPSTTITVSSEGTYTAYYKRPYVPPPSGGAMVNEIWWHIMLSDAAAMTAAAGCSIDALPVPSPAALNWFLNNPANAPYGWTITSTTRAGQSLAFSNNRVWPFGTPNGSPDDPDNWRAMDFRKGVHRLIDKSAIIATYAPLKSAAEAWLPPAQAYWINPDIALPSFDPWASAGWFDAGGFVEGTIPNPYYDPGWHPASAAFLRIDPTTGAPVSFEYYTIGATEEPIGFGMATDITSWMRKMGLTVTLVPGTWLGMVFRLVNDDLYDYQFMTGTGIFWGSLAPHTLFDSTYSEKLPLWNFAHMNISDADYWGLKMMSTLNIEETRHAAFMIQYVLQTYEPYLPLLLDEAFTAFKDPWPQVLEPFTNPGYIGIVNMKGFGALGYSRNKWLLHPSASLVADNVWGKQLGRADRYDPVTGAQINKWRLSAYLDTLNPLTADTEADWQPLSCVMGVLYRLNPYEIEDYMWFGATGMPTIEKWIGPGGAEVTGPGDGVYNAAVTYDGDGELATYNGIAVDDVTADDLVGDDTLGMKTTWELKDCLYWHDSDPGPDLKYGTPDDGVVHQVTAEDYKFGVDLLMNQDNERYHAIWQFISRVKVHDDFHYTVYEERRYPWAFEGHGIGLLTPKHLWEPFIAGDDGILWTEDDRDHRDWYGWEEQYMLDPVRQRAGLSTMWLTHLIGFGPFVYHYNGWVPGQYVHVEENPVYYYPMYGSDPLIGDVTLDGAVFIDDMYIVFDSFGLHPNVDPDYDPRGDIVYWAQTIDLDDVFAAAVQIGKKWYP